MTGLYKLSRQSESVRRAMPLESLVRGFCRATLRRFAVSRLNPPDSIRRVADRNVTSYVEELTRRLMGMWGEENQRMITESQQWDRRVEGGLQSGGPSGLIEHQA